MALSVTNETVRAAASAAAFTDGERLLAADAVGHLESGYGGVNADVADPAGGGPAWQVWVGVNDRALTGECDCGTAAPPSLCAHAVAAALAALSAGTSWAPAPRPVFNAPPRDPVEQRHLALAGTLGAERLAELVARHAVHDRLLATDLALATGQLGVPTTEELRPLRALADRALAVPSAEDGYDLHQVATAARAAVAELRVQALRPATPALLDAAEHTVACWDRLAVLLGQDWRSYGEEVEELGAELADVHLDLCERLRPDPADLARRLAALAHPGGDRDDRPGIACCLEPPAPYRSLLGADGLAAFEREAAARRPRPRVSLLPG
ncbi:hypothetical protein GXW83_20330 [Streptacidiphilus sp. PB12-B1b]|uniref:hypothetical protein n=1 Tax=Streptacidiphilus sp. PB12-B1b TaxID=2705012 RepID=UPI0015FBCDE3|nr:hypothetical protein [Streptacidiphilus sp. PB12-B1b]QMU77688.1 hypothetical protein GXW83_20330 [Streptacidiphilus sp. PB12-B1b]